MTDLAPEEGAVVKEVQVEGDADCGTPSHGQQCIIQYVSIICYKTALMNV